MKDHGSQNPLWSKWADISKMMKDQKIGILTLQETHLSSNYVDEVWKFYGMRLEILFSADECNPTGKVGITIVLNKDLIQMDGVEVTNLIPGQAMLARIPWHGSGFFNWLAMYVLNDEQESKRMWNMLTTKYKEQHIPCIDGMSGDFNLVEDAMDRLPTHDDLRTMVEAFAEFKNEMHLHNGWQTSNPNTKDFTFTQMAGTFS
ncbi:hypothetical protein IW262DRAFT_1302064 [Armillaria fumosa]|nr:hypothetical protein IW262DRAFT_1302064 [Armillaria fumosa]